MTQGGTIPGKRFQKRVSSRLSQAQGGIFTLTMVRRFLDFAGNDTRGDDTVPAAPLIRHGFRRATFSQGRRLGRMEFGKVTIPGKRFQKRVSSRPSEAHGGIFALMMVRRFLDFARNDMGGRYRSCDAPHPSRLSPCHLLPGEKALG